MKFLINARRQYLTFIVVAVLQRLVIQELETRVQQLTQESEGLQSSRSKLAKEKVLKLITVALVVVTSGPAVRTWTSVAVILSLETYFRCILVSINLFKFILEACHIVAMKIATSIFLYQKTSQVNHVSAIQPGQLQTGYCLQTVNENSWDVFSSYNGVLRSSLIANPN